jgi:small conductance mechanosensitive channel
MGPPLTTIQQDVCGADPSWACERVLEATDGNEFLATTVDFLIEKPFQILLILVIAFVANQLVRRAIRRFAARVAAGQQSFMRTIKEKGPEVLVGSPSPGRAAARAATIADVLRGLASIAIYGIAGLLVLGELGLDLGPLLAGAGIAGIALGFGAQSLVKDCITGIFMLIEDQFGVGDVIDAGEASGTVEAVSLRSTRLRDVNGTVWHIPNGVIVRVGNKSQQWSRAVIDMPVALNADVRQAEQVLTRVANELVRDPVWAARVLEAPEVLGVESLGPDGVKLRVLVKTKPAEQWGVMRELRVRLKEAFDAEGIPLLATPAVAPAPVPAPADPAPRKASATKKRAAPAQA